MSPDLSSTLMKLSGPILAIIALFVVLRLRGFPWREQTGLQRPSWQRAFVWIGIWVVWAALSEVLIDWAGLPDPAPWKPYPMLVVVLRILAIGVLGPIAEELIFRGVLYTRLSRTRLGAWGAIVVLAAGWAAFHMQYEAPFLILIFLDGVLLGAARRDTASVLVPIVMHIMGNLYSIWQSLSG